MDIRKLAEEIQNNSLIFGCGSALFGLSKYIYDLDIAKFDKENNEKIEKLRKSLCAESSKSDLTQISSVKDELQKIREERDKIVPGFYFVRPYERTSSKSYIQGARLQPYQGIYWISIPKEIIEKFFNHADQWTDEQVASKDKQRRMIAHEMAHEIFRKRYPENTEVDIDANADIFADALLALRKLYTNGVPTPAEKIT
jgi:hypothetical protein